MKQYCYEVLRNLAFKESAAFGFNSFSDSIFWNTLWRDGIEVGMEVESGIKAKMYSITKSRFFTRALLYKTQLGVLHKSKTSW